LHGVAEAAVLLLTAGAMGIQTEVIGRVAGVAVATTYQAGAITRIAESIARTVVPTDRVPTIAPQLTILFAVLAGYIGGAAVGAILGDARASVLVPIAILAALALGITVASQRARSPVI
jgi:uncharacterized membrane protein YoaK (UPF0700 family)